jgi:hypothetical protein
MTSTTKYILVGGAVAVGVVLVARRIAAAQAAASKPTGIVGAVSGLQQTYDSLKTVFAKPAPSTTLAGGGLPYTTGDGTAAVSDATGMRQARQLVPTSTSYYDPKLAGLA